MRNAPNIFQRTIDDIPFTVQWQFLLVYLDDVVVFSRPPEEHIPHVQRMLTLFSDVIVSHKLKKWKFFMDTIDYF